MVMTSVFCGDAAQPHHTQLQETQLRVHNTTAGHAICTQHVTHTTQGGRAAAPGRFTSGPSPRPCQWHATDAQLPAALPAACALRRCDAAECSAAERRGGRAGSPWPRHEPARRCLAGLLLLLLLVRGWVSLAPRGSPLARVSAAARSSRAVRRSAGA